MKLGVSSACFFPNTTEDSVRYLLENGIREIEIFINTHSEVSKDYILELKALIDSYGARVKSIHPYLSSVEDFMLFSAYDRRFTDTVELYKIEFFDTANLLGADIFVLHGALNPTRIGDEACFERFAKLADAGRECGVIVAQENVFGHFSSSPQNLVKMRDYVGDSFNIVFDIKQAVKSGYDPYEFAQMLKPNICHVHISDNGKNGSCLLPGRGELDFNRIIEIIKNGGKDPSVIIELYSSCYENKKQVIDSAYFLSQKLNIEL